MKIFLFALLLSALVAGCIGQTPQYTTSDIIEEFNYSTDTGTCAKDRINVEMERDPVNTLHYTINAGLITPTPCYTARANATYTENSITIDIETFPLETFAICIQCIGSVPFRADMVLKEQAKAAVETVTVVQDGEEIYRSSFR